MTRRLAALMLALTWVVGALLSWQVLAETTRSDPLTATVHVRVGGWSGADPARLYDDLDTWARAHHATIARVTPDMSRGRRGGRDLYLSAHDPSAPILPGSRYQFAHTLPTRIKPLSEAALLGPNGEWVLFGHADERSLCQFFADHGARTLVTHLDPAPVLTPYSTGARAVNVTAILVVMSTAIAVTVLNSRRQGVQRLHGWSTSSILWSQVRPAMVTWAASGVLSLSATMTWLALVHSGGATRFAVQTTVFATILLTAGLATHLITLALISGTRILDVLKGRLPAGYIVTASYVMRCLAVATALALGSQVIVLSLDVQHLDESQAPLQSLGKASVITFGNAFDQASLESALHHQDEWMKHLDQLGLLLVAHRDDQQILPGHPIVVVNTTYLRRYPLPGHEVPAGGVIVALPAALWADRAAITSTVISGLDHLLPPSGTPRPLEVPDGRTVFTLSPPPTTSSSDVSSAMIRDAVVVAVPNGTLGSYASLRRQEALVTDPDAARRDLATRPQVAAHVQSIVPAAIHARELADETRAERDDIALADVVAWGVVVISGIAATSTHIARHRMRTFVRTISGWPMTATHRGLLIVESVLLMVIVGWLPVVAAVKARHRAQELEMAGLPTPTASTPLVSGLDLIPVLALVLLTTGGFALTLAIVHRSAIRTAHRGM